MVEDCTNTLRCSSNEKINESPYSQNTCIGNCQCVPENLSSNSCAFVGCQKYKLAKDTCSTGICTVKECCTTCSMVKDKTIDGYFYDTAKENTCCPRNDADSCLTNPNLCFTKKVQCKDLDPRTNNEIMQVLVLPENYYYDPSKGERYCNSNNTSSRYENKNYDLCFTSHVRTYKNNPVTSHYYRKAFIQNNIPNIYCSFHYFKQNDTALRYYL